MSGLNIAAAIAAYLLGAIPNGLLIAKSRGVDIRKVGSGNIGATNVFRGVGKSWGLLTFLLDALKGFIPAFVFPVIIGDSAYEHLPVICAASAVAGHNWPVYLKFKGGKGIATTAGALLAVAPITVGISFVVWLAAFLSTRYVSLGSILAAVAVPLSGWFFYREDMVLEGILIALGGVGIWRHRSNIGRLLSGTESRITFGTKTNTADAPAPPPSAEGPQSTDS